MRRGTFAIPLLLMLPLAVAPIACGDGDDRAALEQDELDRELDMALGADTGVTTLGDTAIAPPPEAQPEGQTAQTPPRPQPRQQTPTRTQPQQQPREQPRQPAAPQPRTVTLAVPTGTTFAVRMNDALSTETSKVGDSFTATLTDPIVNADGTVIIPAGATVRGRVTAVAPSTRVGQTAALKLAFEAISFGGDSYPLQAAVERADVEQKSRTGAGETAGKVAAGAAAGAILGQVLGKDKESTLKGAAIGAAAGTAIAMGTADVDAVLPRGAEVIIRLEQPISVTKTVSG